MRFAGWILLIVGAIFGWDGLQRWGGLAELDGTLFYSYAATITILTLGLGFVSVMAGVGFLNGGKHRHSDSGYPEEYRRKSSKKIAKEESQ